MMRRRFPQGLTDCATILVDQHRVEFLEILLGALRVRKMLNGRQQIVEGCVVCCPCVVQSLDVAMTVFQKRDHCLPGSNAAWPSQQLCRQI